MMHFLCATHKNCVQQRNTINAYLPLIDLPALETSRKMSKNCENALQNGHAMDGAALRVSRATGEKEEQVDSHTVTEMA